MAYKLLGFIVWRVATGYLRLRFRGLSTGRRAILAGGLLAVVAALAGGAKRRTSSGQLTP
jgi:hypothetical protein